MVARETHPGSEVRAVALEESLRLLANTGLLLGSARNLDAVAQAALEAGAKLCGASFGAFVLAAPGHNDDALEFCQTIGADPDWFTGLPFPPASGPVALDQVQGNEKILQSDDITSDARYLRHATSYGRPVNSPQVRSYMAIPLRDRDRTSLGALLFAHGEPGVFRQGTEEVLASIAFQAAAAVQTFRLTEMLQREAALSEHARAEQRSMELRLRQALDAANQGTWRWDAASGLIDFDERGAALFGVKPHTPVPREVLWESLLLEEDRVESPRDLHELLEVGIPYAAEYRIGLPEGGLRWIAANGIPVVEDATGKVTGMTGTVQDISLRKNQEDSLRQSEKLAATGRLAATIAHEINNPLEAVTNLIYLAKTDPSTPAPVERLLDTADNELARVSQIAQQTLGFYRDTTNPVMIDVNQLLGAVVDLFGRKLAIKRLQVTLDLDPDLSIKGLQGEIRQVVSNLLVNAIDASSTVGSSIRIRGRHRQRNGCKGISVIISDEGSGIPAHVQHRLFTPFVTTKQSHGTGLGLWVTRGMIEKHGGTVRFRSRTEAPAGTVFRVFLPQSANSEAFTSQSTALIQ